jgi:ATP-dependent RNA helicase DDX5/DBP2
MDGPDNTNKILIFTGTKKQADEITRFLRQDGWPALCRFPPVLSLSLSLL